MSRAWVHGPLYPPPPPPPPRPAPHRRRHPPRRRRRGHIARGRGSVPLFPAWHAAAAAAAAATTAAAATAAAAAAAAAASAAPAAAAPIFVSRFRSCPIALSLSPVRVLPLSPPSFSFSSSFAVLAFRRDAALPPGVSKDTDAPFALAVVPHRRRRRHPALELRVAAAALAARTALALQGTE